MFRVMVATIVGSMLYLPASAETRNVIRQFNSDLTPGVHYVVNNDLRRIRIISGVAALDSRFKFEARTEELIGGQWVDIGVGDINLIEIQPGGWHL